MSTAAVPSPAEGTGKEPKQEPPQQLISPSAPAPRKHIPFKFIPYSSHTRHLDPSAAAIARPTGANELRKYIMRKQPPRDSQPGSCNNSDPGSLSPSPDQFPADHTKPQLKGNAPRKSPLKGGRGGGRGRHATITGATGHHAHPFSGLSSPRHSHVDPSICNMCQRAKATHRPSNNLCDRCNRMYPGCRRIGMKHEDVTRMLSMIPNHEKLEERMLTAQVKEKYKSLQLRAAPDMYAQNASAHAGRTGGYRTGTMSPNPGRAGRGAGLYHGPGARMHGHGASLPGQSMSGRPKTREEKMRRAATFAFSTEITFGRDSQSRAQRPRMGVGQMVEERCAPSSPLVDLLKCSLVLSTRPAVVADVFSTREVFELRRCCHLQVPTCLNFATRVITGNAHVVVFVSLWFGLVSVGAAGGYILLMVHRGVRVGEVLGDLSSAATTLFLWARCTGRTTLENGATLSFVSLHRPVCLRVSPFLKVLLLSQRTGCSFVGMLAPVSTCATRGKTLLILTRGTLASSQSCSLTNSAQR